jgi:hypothetical protein
MTYQTQKTGKRKLSANLDAIQAKIERDCTNGRQDCQSCMDWRCCDNINPKTPLEVKDCKTNQRSCEACRWTTCRDNPKGPR